MYLGGTDYVYILNVTLNTWWSAPSAAVSDVGYYHPNFMGSNHLRIYPQLAEGTPYWSEVDLWRINKM